MVEGPPRLSPDQLTVMKLFEIADRLAEIAPPVGIVRSFGALTADDNSRSIAGAMRSASIYNDGAQDVYIWANEDENREPWRVGDAPLAPGEKLDLDFKGFHYGLYAYGRKIYYRCRPGESTTIKGWLMY